jgi:hypothetical protein
LTPTSSSLYPVVFDKRSRRSDGPACSNLRLKQNKGSNNSIYVASTARICVNFASCVCVCVCFACGISGLGKEDL